jgi:hypothetical protein
LSSASRRWCRQPLTQPSLFLERAVSPLKSVPSWRRRR